MRATFVFMRERPDAPWLDPSPRGRDAGCAVQAWVRVEVERLPNEKLPPRPLWLAWIGGPLPADLSVLWRLYLGGLRPSTPFAFSKQTLGWTTVRPRRPRATDRWTWLMAGAYWQLWLARRLVRDVRLPWEHPRPDPPAPPRAA